MGSSGGLSVLGPLGTILPGALSPRAPSHLFLWRYVVLVVLGSAELLVLGFLVIGKVGQC